MKTYYKINEISKLYGIGQDSLRYYEELGILHPKRDHNNYRQYTTSDIYRLNVIRDLRNLNFSMQAIKNYLEHRTIANTLSLLEEEERIIDQKIEDLRQLKQDVRHRQQAVSSCMEIEEGKMEILELPQRCCVAFTSDVVQEDMEYQLIKLSKEYEKNIYTIANFNTGCFLTMDADGTIHPASVFIVGDTLQSYEFTLPEGTYLNLYYRGKRDTSYHHLKKMMAYCHARGYRILDAMMEFFIIDTHETRLVEEYITQLQIHIER